MQIQLRCTQAIEADDPKHGQGQRVELDSPPEGPFAHAIMYVPTLPGSWSFTTGATYTIAISPGAQTTTPAATPTTTTPATTGTTTTTPATPTTATHAPPATPPHPNQRATGQTAKPTTAATSKPRPTPPVGRRFIAG